MRRAALFLALLLLTGCTLVYRVFGPPYDPNGPAASRLERAACREHCKTLESDRHAASCWVSCASLRDPWYSSH